MLTLIPLFCGEKPTANGKAHKRPNYTVVVCRDLGKVETQLIDV